MSKFTGGLNTHQIALNHHCPMVFLWRSLWFPPAQKNSQSLIPASQVPWNPPYSSCTLELLQIFGLMCNILKLSMLTCVLAMIRLHALVNCMMSDSSIYIYIYICKYMGMLTCSKYHYGNYHVAHENGPSYS